MLPERVHIRLNEPIVRDKPPKYHRNPTGGAARRDRLEKIDGRTKPAKRLRTITLDLVAHLGSPERVNPAQRYLIERVAIDILRLEKLDLKTAGGTFASTHGGIGSTTERLDI
jgi:hypothetical protein